MKPYSNVLVATNFSAACDAACRRAAAIAAGSGARVCLLNVIEHFPEDIPVTPVAPEDVDPRAYLVDLATRKLHDLAGRMNCKSAERLVQLTVGSAAREIVSVARDRKADLVVVGVHMRHPVIGRMGSTALGVVQSAPCDVLTVVAGA